MPATPLAPRVLLLSLAVALVVWPLVWLLLAVAQGVGVMLGGGEFIGISMPWGQYPWALVNQPSVAYSSSRAALWGYWLPSTLVAGALAGLVAILAPSSRRWGGELAVHHVACAAAALGLGWAPALGMTDGPARGLERFWDVPDLGFVGACALVGVALSWLPVTRLAGGLWHQSAQLTLTRRVAVAALHGVLPASIWVALVHLQGWRPGLLPVLGIALVAFGPVAVLVLRIPRASMHRRELPSAIWLGSLWLISVAVLGVALAAGAPSGRSARGFVWAKPSATNNIRVDWHITPLRPGVVRPGQEERGWVP